MATYHGLAGHRCNVEDVRGDRKDVELVVNHHTAFTCGQGQQESIKTNS